MRERQAAQVAAALILRAGRAVGKFRLMKLMYLVEREAIKRHGFPVVFDDIYAMQNGMALSRTYDLMIQKPGTPTNGEWARYIERSSSGLITRRHVSTESLDDLTPNDVAVVDDVWRAHGRTSKDELIHTVHHQLDEWTTHWHDANRKKGAVLVPYAKVYQVLLGLNDEEAADAANEVAYFRAVSKPARPYADLRVQRRQVKQVH